MFGLSRIEIILLGCIAVAILTASGLYWTYEQGKSVEKGAQAGRTLEETEKGRKARETNDEAARRLDDARALECLRKPAGC
jgi:hypothetical protein